MGLSSIAGENDGNFAGVSSTEFGRVRVNLTTVWLDRGVSAHSLRSAGLNVVVKAIRRWGIYQVPDGVIDLPPKSAKRKLKNSRYFVVISSTNLDFVVGCPTSTDPDMVIDPWDVELPAGACGTRQECWVRVPAIQPLDKVHLTNRTGIVPNEDHLRRKIAMNIFDFLALDQLD